MSCQIALPIFEDSCDQRTKPWALSGVVSSIKWPSFEVGGQYVSFLLSFACDIPAQPEWLSDGVFVEAGFDGKSSYVKQSEPIDSKNIFNA